jgi:hypothetical protein
VEVGVFFDISNKGQNFLFGNLWFWELITAIGDSVFVHRDACGKTFGYVV